MTSMVRGAAAAALSVASVAAHAAVITLDFEGVGDTAQIENFYNGGTDSEGHHGINYGVSFVYNALGLIDYEANGSGDFANEPTPNTVMFFSTGVGAILNYAPGFRTGFSFYYSSSKAATVNVYEGLDGTGRLLGSIALAAQYNANHCTGNPDGLYCNWSVGDVAFDGIAKSIDFSGAGDYVAYDNITFGSTDPSVSPPPGPVSVPEPGSLALAAPALVGMAAARRRRRA